MRRLGPVFGQLLLTVLAGGGVSLLSLAGAFAPFDLPTGDLFLDLDALLRPADPVTSPVVAVVLDDATLDAFGPLPWPRAQLAALVDAIFDQSPRGVALDLVLNEPGDPDGDARLAAALDRGPTVLAAALRPDGGWLLPLDRYGGAGRAAHAEAEVGPDGVVRTILATKQRQGLALPALSLAAARLVRPEIPVTPGTALHPSFHLPPRSIQAVSVLDLATMGTALPGSARSPLRGRLVFVGTTATAASDQFLVPTGTGPAPGVLIHASATASILAADPGTGVPGEPAARSAGGLLRHPGALGLTLCCLALAALAQAARARAGRLRLTHFALAGAGLALAGAAALMLAGVRLPLVTLAAAFGLSALLRESVESAAAQRQTGHLLRRLVVEGREGPAAAGDAQPTTDDGGDAFRRRTRSAAGRLELARELQEEVIRDRNLRRALLDGLEDGVIRWDGDGHVVLANRAAHTLWGGRAPGLSEALAAAGIDSPRAAGSTSGEAGDAGALLRHRGRELRLLIQPLGDDAGSGTAGSLAVLRDVTAERELESRRREMQRLVSHELKTPLASIASFGGMLERYELSPEELDRVAGLIRGESERLLDMVTTFLDLERIGSGRWTAEREPVDLAALARERVEVLAAGAHARNLGLEIATEGDCRVSGDSTLLARVIDNLVGNAVKYSATGGRITVRVAHRTATGPGAPDAPDGPPDRVDLAVADDGPGIPQEAQKHLFERFYRVPPPRSGADGEATPAPSGTGLGLALVREIAEWHGGCVHVQSEAGSGSVFTVHLPALGPTESTMTR